MYLVQENIACKCNSIKLTTSRSILKLIELINDQLTRRKVGIAFKTIAREIEYFSTTCSYECSTYADNRLIFYLNHHLERYTFL